MKRKRIITCAFALALAALTVFFIGCQRMAPMIPDDKNISTTPPLWMYWTQNYENIWRATPDGMRQQVLATGIINIKDIALDVAGGKMYWTTYSFGKKIQRANLDGSNIEDVITELGEPLAIALDVTNQTIYWTESHPSKICRANFDGSNVEVLVSGLYHPSGIALDVANGKMYWVDTGSDNAEDKGKGKVQRANLDGSNVEDLVSRLDQPEGIALDVANGKMYWTDWYAGLIQRANLDRSPAEDLITSPIPSYIALGISQIEPPTPMKPVVEELPEDRLVSFGVCDVGDVLRLGVLCYLMGDDPDNVFFGNTFFEVSANNDGPGYLSLLGASSLAVEHFDADGGSVHKFMASKQKDGLWRIDAALPPENIGCGVGDLIKPGHSCVLLIEGKFTVSADGRGFYQSYHDSHIDILGSVDAAPIDFSAEKREDSTWRVTDAKIPILPTVIGEPE